jgi:tetratricopeptide (TPR) repeat protein
LRRRYPEAPNVHYACGTFLLSSNPDAALEEFRQELKLTPTHLPSLLQIAFEYIKRNDYEAARPFAEKSVQLAPGIVGTHHALGNVLLETGDIPGAIKQLEKGAELAPDSPEMHFALAKAYSRAGRKEDAARARNTFLRLDKERRTQREGAQSVGGLEAKPGDRNPPQK